MTKIKITETTSMKKGSKNVLELNLKKPKKVGAEPALPKTKEIVKSIEQGSYGALETRYFKVSFLKDKLEQALISEESVQKINSLNIEGEKDKLVVTTDIEVIDEGVNMKGVITATFENKKNTIDIAQDLKIKTDLKDKILISIFLKPELKDFSAKIKEYFEDEKLEDGNNYEVSSIQIKNGQLEVVFKK
jgi:hypothetical protein